MPSQQSSLILWSITAALAGFIFGFDLIVISGAEQNIQSLWGLSGNQHGWAMSAALWGTVLGSLLGSIPTDKYGRKKTLISIGLLYFISAIASALSPSFGAFIPARFIGGIGIGISTIAAPLFIAEISPAKRRGILTGMFQFNIVFGILIAFASNYIIGQNFSSEVAWRWMMGIEAIPALIYTCMCFTLPESPRWLITVKRDPETGIAVLKKINPEMTTSEVELIANEISDSVKSPNKSSSIDFGKLKTPIALAFLIAFFNQLSGINAILGFAPRIFEQTGLGEQAARLQSTGIGLTNLIFTFIGLWLIDRLGRRTLLYIGSFGYILTLALTTWAFQSGNLSIVPLCIFAFIGAHAIGQGAVIWVFISEIFPARARAFGQSLGSATHWVFAAILTYVFPVAMDTFAPAQIFGFFCFIMILQLLWVKTMVPETKGRTLEELGSSISS